MTFKPLGALKVKAGTVYSTTSQENPVPTATAFYATEDCYLSINGSIQFTIFAKDINIIDNNSKYVFSKSVIVVMGDVS